METLNKNQILDKWKNVNNDNLFLYIHSPFCIDNCKYCVYKGTPLNSDQYDNYYNDYLLRQIDFYKDVIERNKVRSIFFGGGTPSLTKVKDLNLIKEKLPKWENIYKIFELHPAYYNNDTLEFVRKEFNTVIIGVQSFDKRVLEHNNRTFVPFEEIKKLVNYLKAGNVEVFLDLIELAYYEDERDFEITFNDIRNVIKLNIDEFTVSPVFNMIEQDKDEIKNSFINNKAYKENLFTKLIEKLLSKKWIFENYRIADFDNNDKTFNGMLKYLSENLTIRLIHKNTKTKYFQPIPEIKNGVNIPLLKSEPDYKNSLKGEPSLLGIGSFRNKSLDTYSVIKDKFIYIEKNYDNKEPTYIELFNKYEPSYIDLIKEFYTKIDSLIEETFSIKIEFGKDKININENPHESYFFNTLNIVITADNDFREKIEKIRKMFAKNPFIKIENA